MTRLAAALLVLVLGAASASAATDPTAEAKRVYAEVNDNLAGFERVSVELELPDAPAPAEVTGWNDDGDVRKIEIVYPGDHGATTEDYYYAAADDGGALTFVFQRIETAAADGSRSTTRENRYYFRDGQLFRWLDDKRKPVSPKSDEFSRAEQDLLDAADAALAALTPPEPTDGLTAPDQSADGPANAEELSGTFTGIEEGDYFHLNLKVGGEERSFFILDTDAAIDKLLADPDAYVGKKITIVWQKAVEDIPEAGGKMEIEKLLTVKLP